MKKLILLTMIVLGLGLIVCASSHAYFRVDNTGQIIYYSNVYCAYSYTFSDTARILVLYGPKMYLQKNVRNDVTGDSSANQVPVGRGDTITIFLYSANNEAEADTAAWHVFVYDKFDSFTAVGGGQTATVGEAVAAESFTYVAGSETLVYVTGFADSVVTPNSITYYIEGTGWLGSFTEATQTFTGTWYNYTSAREDAITPAQVQGIKWYWRYVPADKYYDAASESEKSTGLPYLTHVKFSLKKNDN